MEAMQVDGSLATKPVRNRSTNPTTHLHTNWAGGDLAPELLLTAEREKEPVVVYHLLMAPAKLARPRPVISRLYDSS